jgi:Lrp/AsnC family transcriptional regulator for asnA, asnC and gidA
MPTRSLDETDRLLIAELQRDARQSNQSIATALGVSEGTVRSRTKRLEDDEVVRIATIRNIEALGELAAAYLWITCDRSRLRELGGRLSKDPGIGFVASTLGRADLLAIVFQESPSGLVRFVDEVVKPLPGVIDVRTEPILQLVKNDARWGLVAGVCARRNPSGTAGA